MTRVSLTEDYDDRSVIAKLRKLTDAVNTTSIESKEAIEKAKNAVQLTGESTQVIDGTVIVDVIEAGSNSEIAGASFEESDGKTIISNEKGVVINDIVPTNVSVSEEGVATRLAKYITVDGEEWKLGGGDGKVKDVQVNSVSVLDESTGVADINLTDYAKKTDIPTDYVSTSKTSDQGVKGGFEVGGTLSFAMLQWYDLAQCSPDEGSILVVNEGSTYYISYSDLATKLGVSTKSTVTIRDWSD